MNFPPSSSPSGAGVPSPAPEAICSRCFRPATGKVVYRLHRTFGAIYVCAFCSRMYPSFEKAPVGTVVCHASLEM